MSCAGDGLLCSVGACPDCLSDISGIVSDSSPDTSGIESLSSPLETLPEASPAYSSETPTLTIPGEALTETEIETILSVTPEEWAEYLRSEQAEDMKASLYDFFLGAWEAVFQHSHGKLDLSPYIKALCDHVQMQLEDRAIASGKAQKPPGWTGIRAQNLLIEIPPRCLKTFIVTICGTAWAWLRWPSLKIMVLSSNKLVYEDSAYQTRDLIRSQWYQKTFKPKWQLSEDRESLTNFVNTAGGWRVSRGILARTTGIGANWIVVDDPHDSEEVFSDAKRKAVLQKWTTAVSNRLNDPRYDLRTGIMQAQHFDDWGEHRKAEGWGTLIIPMVWEERFSGRKSCYGWMDWRTIEGETVLPARYTADWIKATVVEKGPLLWSAQYQQDPVSIDGGIIKSKDLRYYDDASELKLDRLVVSVDASFKKTESGSRVAVLVIGSGKDSTGKQIRALLDCVCRPMHLEETLEAIRAMRRRWPKARTVLIEDKANGSEIIRRLQQEIVGVVPVNPGNNSKVGRLMSVEYVFTGQAFLLPKQASWLEDFRFELLRFPNHKHDDQVDAMTQALAHLRLSSAAARSLAGARL